MNILLVKPRPHKDSINLQSFMLCEPLELEYAAALLKQLGHWADIVDMVLEDDFPAILKTKDYQVVAFTAYQIHVGIVKEYARQVKDNNSSIVTLVGGVHAEVVPEDFDSPFLDVVLTGGMYALEGVIAGIERREGQEELRALGRTPKQLHFRFPHPDRSKTAKYRPHYNYIYHDRCATIKTSFSCPYNCSFCFCTQLGPYFQREMADVLDELEEIQEENIFIVDDDFLFDPQRLEDFCRGLEERGTRKTFLAFGRADFIAEHEELVALLARHGFDAFFVGLESFKEGELEEYQKRTTVEVNNRAVRILEKHGVQCYSGLIVGYDWEKMAHAVLELEHMSKRAFYYHILRAYWKTAASRKGRQYIRERYGRKVYRRVRRGALCITWQYLKLIVCPN